MSEAVSALQGAEFEGLARVAEAGLQGMITLRGDLGARAVRAAVKAAFGVDVPDVNNVASAGHMGVCWMSPDELLLLCPHGEAEAKVAELGTALAKQHHLAVNVSDARAMFQVNGSGAREVLGKLCPLDFAPGKFEPGQIRRTRMAQVPAAVWMDGVDTFRVVCFRSMARYVFGALKAAADPASGVGVY